MRRERVSLGALEIMISHELMMRRRKMLGEIVTVVVLSGSPVEIELLLSNAILEPMILHIKGFRALHADGSMKDIVCSRVIRFEWSTSWRLWMPKFFKRGYDWNGVLSRQKEAACLGLGGGSGDTTDGFTEHINSNVMGRLRWVSGWLIAEKINGSTSAARLRQD